MNQHRPGNGALLTKLSQARSKDKRAAALVAATRFSTAQEIAEAANVSLKIAGQTLSSLRFQKFPQLIDHQISMSGVTYEDLVKLSERFSLSDARLRVLAKKHRLTKVWAINPQTKRLSACYRPEEFERRLPSWSSRYSHFLKYRDLIRNLKIERYEELSDPLMATLIGLVVLLKDNSGAPPSYEEIEQAAGLPAKKSRQHIPELERLGFITRLPVYNPRRGQPSFRYLIHRAPAKLVTHPIRCSECGSSTWIAFPWYQAKRFGNGVGK